MNTARVTPWVSAIQKQQRILPRKNSGGTSLLPSVSPSNMVTHKARDMRRIQLGIIRYPFVQLLNLGSE